ncbi:MAG: hypothetical protein M3N07_06620, partial [Pseudomonadota bacterium]|nr:hypothetical protein [Pseudomonadota bacterium]
SALAACAAATLLLRQVPRPRMRAAYWLLFLAVGAAVTAIAPGGAILFLFPPLLVAAGILAGAKWPAAERIGALAAATLLFLIFAPLLDLLETLLGLGSAWMFAPVAALILWPWLIELMPLLAAVRMRWVLAGAGAAWALGWTAAALAPAYSQDRQQQFGIEYAWDADARRGRWAVANDGAALPEAFREAADWEQGVEVAWSTRRRWTAPAPPLPLEAPWLEGLAQHEADGGRLLSFRLRTGGAYAVMLRADPSAGVRAVRAGGFTRAPGEGDPDDPWMIRCTGRSCDGAIFQVLVGSRTPTEWTAIGFHGDLPAAAEPLIQARPAHARPQYAPDGSIAYRRLRL